MLPPDVVAKLNECAHIDFVSMRDWWFGWVSDATKLVAFGLVLEAPELIHDLVPIGRKIIAGLKKLSIEFPKHEAPDWVKVVAFIGWILIVVGVVGEEFAGTKVKNLDANIQECSDAKVRAATIEAGDAATSARIAHEEADAVKGIADEARADAQDALAKAQAAQHELAHAEADAAKAQTVASKALNTADKAESHLADALKRAANAELELARIKTPRSLNLGQQEHVAKALSQFARQSFALMVFSDGESIGLATEIDGTLKAARWERVGTPSGLGGDIAINIGGVMAPTINVVGLRLWAGDDASEAAARALQKALSSPDINIPSGVERSKWIKDRGLKLVVIEVGQKQI